MKFLRAILNNITIKLISLFLALLTWGYISSELYKKTVVEDKESHSILKVSGEKTIVKTLPIYANIEGEPAAGYRVMLDRIAISPSDSVVAGPPEVVEGLSYITTLSININGESSNVRKMVGLIPIQNCRIGYEGQVRVVVPITKIRYK